MKAGTLAQGVWGLLWTSTNGEEEESSQNREKLYKLAREYKSYLGRGVTSV